jgi:hypothetical protein
MTAILENHKEAIAELCRKYSVQRLFAFGSAIRDDFRPGESDVDLLVEFAPIGGHAKFHLITQLAPRKADLLHRMVHTYQ